MKPFYFIIFAFFLLNTEVFGQTNLEVKAGTRFLSIKSLNDALIHEGYPKLNTNALYVYFGRRYETEKWIFNTGISVLGTSGKDNSNISQFMNWGFSIEAGYKIWGNEKMNLYPYCNIPYILSSQIRTQQKTDANSFESVYQQPLVDRTFVNRGELDSTFGLKCAVKIGKSQLLTIGGGYNFKLYQSKWAYVENKIEDFPRADCRGWEIAISLSTFKNK